MRSFTPQISWHNRDPILSVDFQNRPLATTTTTATTSAADCQCVYYRMATSGNDSHVIIWKVNINDTAPVVVDPKTNKRSPNVSIECLADLTRHQRPVNVVRFSPNPNDNLLAAGDDDCFIYIWKLMDDSSVNNTENELKSDVNLIVPKKSQEFCVKHKDNSQEDDEIMILEEQSAAIKARPAAENAANNMENTAFGDEEMIATEVWKPLKILRGHLQDVSDVCWSPDGQQLVSASVDNTAIVWDVHKGQKLHKIVEHKGFVQGVAWDPIGKYLATLSADRNMRVIDAKSGRTVYRVHRMRTEESNKTSRLFYDDTLRSFCRRLTFTPGGEFLIAPSGILELTDENSTTDKDNGTEETNKYINTTYIFERKSLNKPSFYLPSKKYTIAVSCCPKLFQLQENLENHFQFPYRVVFAVATQDSVLFYDSQQDLPFGQVSQIHYLRLTDLQWSPDGRMLIVSSTDGFATFITFEANELGVPYDGPAFNFNETEASVSPVITGKNSTKLNSTASADNVMTTPEVDRTVKPKVATPAITAFFKPTDVQRTPDMIVKPLCPQPQNQSNCPQNGTTTTPKQAKSPNVLVPRKKIKLTTIEPIETIEIN